MLDWRSAVIDMATKDGVNANLMDGKDNTVMLRKPCGDNSVGCVCVSITGLELLQNEQYGQAIMDLAQARYIKARSTLEEECK